MELPASQSVILKDRIRKLESRIDENPVHPIKHLGIHSAHRGSNDKIRILLGNQILKKINSLNGIHRKIRGDNGRVGQEQPERVYATGLSARRESMYI